MCELVIKGGDGGLFVVKFPLIEYYVGEVVDGTLMYLIHEIFDVGFWDVEFLKLFDGLFMYDPSDSGCDRDEWFCVPSFVSYFVN